MTPAQAIARAMSSDDAPALVSLWALSRLPPGAWTKRRWLADQWGAMLVGGHRGLGPAFLALGKTWSGWERAGLLELDYRGARLTAAGRSALKGSGLLGVMKAGARLFRATAPTMPVGTRFRWPVRMLPDATLQVRPMFGGMARLRVLLADGELGGSFGLLEGGHGHDRVLAAHDAAHGPDEPVVALLDGGSMPSTTVAGVPRTRQGFAALAALAHARATPRSEARWT